MRQHLGAYAAYNVFQRKQQPTLRCAVRQDRPVPAFIWSETWAFWGITTAEEPLHGFQPEAAAEAMRFTGYYFFKALDCQTGEDITPSCPRAIEGDPEGQRGEHG